MKCTLRRHAEDHERLAPSKRNRILAADRPDRLPSARGNALTFALDTRPGSGHVGGETHLEWKERPWTTTGSMPCWMPQLLR